MLNEIQLGMKYGTAMNRLKRRIMWNLLEQLNQTTCFRCLKEMNESSYSIEHIHPWRNEDTELFWDISNIKFSHRGCNSSAARRIVIHGKGRYNKGCRCQICCDANTLKARRTRSRHKALTGKTR